MRFIMTLPGYLCHTNDALSVFILENGKRKTENKEKGAEEGKKQFETTFKSKIMLDVEWVYCSLHKSI